MQPAQRQPINPLPPQHPSKRRTPLIIAGVVMVLAVLGGVGFWLYSSATQSPKTGSSILNDLKNPSLTTANLQGVNKDDAFYAYIKQAAQEQKMTITKSFHYSDDGKPQEDDAFSKVGVDYQTKKIVYAYETDEDNPNRGRSRIRCYDGKEYTRYYEWTQETKPTDCTKDKLYGSTTDGFNAGGLTAAQAETFVSYLRGKQGLITVKDMSLATHAGKRYVHFTALLQQIDVNDTQFAAQWLMFAFKKTGLNPDDHPYGYVGSGGQGFTLDYYIDPGTSLPAYSEISSLPRTDDAGKSDTSSYHFRIQYDFTSSSFDASPANDTDIAITW